MSKLDDILATISIAAVDLSVSPNAFSGEVPDRFRYETKEQVKSLILELIGSDELGEWPGKYLTEPEKFREPYQHEISVGGRNQLRRELRREVEKL